MQRLYYWSLAMLIIVSLNACSSARSVDQFYNQHKDDSQVTALRIPSVMINMLSGISPEMQSLFGNTDDIRLMKFSGLSPAKSSSLNSQINNLTSSSFIEVYRKNDEAKRNVISIREKRNTVKEILFYKTDNLNTTLLYLNGNYEPAKVRSLAESDQFDNVAESLNLVQ